MQDEKDDQSKGLEPETDTSKATGTMVPNEDAKPDATEDKVEDSEKDLPEWAQKQLKKARDEAASYRVRSRELSEALAKAKTPEEFANAQKEWEQTQQELEREIVAAKYNLPEPLAKRLAGSTREELEADAKLLQTLVTPPQEEVPHYHSASGGLTPFGDDEDRMTPQALAKKYGQKRILF